MPDHCDCSNTEPSKVTVEISSGPRWMDAPCCEGYWWRRSHGGQRQIMRVREEGGIFKARSFDDADISNGPSYEWLGGRWYGPILPPE